MTRWGVRGPSGRIWAAETWVGDEGRAAAGEFAAATGMQLLSRDAGEGWTVS